MDKLSPQAEVLMQIRSGLEKNKSAFGSLQDFGDLPSTEFGRQVQKILEAHSSGQSYWPNVEHSQLSISIYSLISRALAGESIAANLQELEAEAIRDSFDQIDRFTKKLPFLLMMPLFVFMFPSLVVLMLTPLLLSLLQF